MHRGRGDSGSWLTSFDVFGSEDSDVFWSIVGRLVAGWGGLLSSFSSCLFSTRSLPVAGRPVAVWLLSLFSLYLFSSHSMLFHRLEIKSLKEDF